MASDGQEPGQGELTLAQRSQMEQRQADQDRTLLAMRQLEAALAAAAPRREQAWRTEVRSALGVLAEAASSEPGNAMLPDSLLSTSPVLSRGCATGYGAWTNTGQLDDSITALLTELEEPADAMVDFADLRQRLAWVLTGLRHQRARESDLIYEAYYDAFRSDIALDADRVPGGRRRRKRPNVKQAPQAIPAVTGINYLQLLEDKR